MSLKSICLMSQGSAFHHISGKVTRTGKENHVRVNENEEN